MPRIAPQEPRSTSRFALQVCLPLLLPLCACPSLTTLHTARPLPEGRTEIALVAGVYAFEESGTEVLPVLEAQVRRGFDERLDAGVKLTSLSMLSADLNYALILGERFALSVDPTLSVFVTPIDEVFLFFVWLPILADVYTSEDFTLTLAVKPGYVDVDVDVVGGDLGFSESTELLGLGIGARWRVSEKLFLLPEVNALLFREEQLDEEVIYTFSLGFAF